MSKRAEEEGLARIAERRRRVEERLAAVRGALAGETGRAPVRPGLVIAMVAGAVGLALAMRRRSAGRPQDAALP